MTLAILSLGFFNLGLRYLKSPTKVPLTKRTSDSKHDKMPLKLHGGAGVLRTWSWPGAATEGSRAGTHIPWDQAGCGDQGALLIRLVAKTFPNFP